MEGACPRYVPMCFLLFSKIRIAFFEIVISFYNLRSYLRFFQRLLQICNNVLYIGFYSVSDELLFAECRAGDAAAARGAPLL